MERLLTVQELAEYLQLPVQTIYRWRAMQGGPPGYRVGRHVRFDAAEVDSWLRERRDGAKAGSHEGAGS